MSAPTDPPARNTRLQTLEQRKQQLRAQYPPQQENSAHYETQLQHAAANPESFIDTAKLALASVGEYPRERGQPSRKMLVTTEQGLAIVDK